MTAPKENRKDHQEEKDPAAWSRSLADRHRLFADFLRWARQAGLTRQSFLVGGAVRDLLLGRGPTDLDLLILEDVEEIATRFSQASGAHRLLIGAAFQNIRVVRDGEHLDLSGPRGQSVEEDLRRRDFSINAMAVPLCAPNLLSQIIDPCHGLEKLRADLIDLTGPDSLAEDPLRLLRAFRFRAELGFEIAPATLLSIQAHAPLISGVAGERVFSELKRLLATPKAASTVSLMAGTGLLFEIFPELAPTVGFAQENRHHAWEVWTHTEQALWRVEEILSDIPADFGDEPELEKALSDPWLRTMLKLALIFHDSGKPESRKREANQGRTGTFYGHEAIGAEKIRTAALRLRAPARETDLLESLVRHHLRIPGLSRTTPKTPALIRLLGRLRDLVYPLLAHGLADLRAKGPEPGPGDPAWQAEAAYLGTAHRLLHLYHHQFLPRAALPRLLNGRDVMRLCDLPPSPLVGRILKKVEQAVLEGRVSTAPEAEALARSVLASLKTRAASPTARNSGRV